MVDSRSRNPIQMQVVSGSISRLGLKVFAGLLEQPGTGGPRHPGPIGRSRAFCDRMNAFAQAEGLPGMGYIFGARSGGRRPVPVAKALGPERTGR